MSHDPLAHALIRQLTERLDRLQHLESIEVVPPLQKDETLGAGLVISLDESGVTSSQQPIIAYTQFNTIIPAVGDTVPITVTTEVGTDVWMVPGQTLIIDDGGVRQFYGSIVSVDDPYNFTFKLGRETSPLPTAWDSLTAYVDGDTASLAGIAYTSILANTNKTPPDEAYWLSDMIPAGAGVIISGDPEAGIQTINGDPTPDQLITSIDASVTIDNSTPGTTDLSVTGGTGTGNILTINGFSTADIAIGVTLQDGLILYPISSVAAWDSLTSYNEGTFAESAGIIYQSIVSDGINSPNLNHLPPDPAWWKEIPAGAQLFLLQLEFSTDTAIHIAYTGHTLEFSIADANGTNRGVVNAGDQILGSYTSTKFIESLCVDALFGLSPYAGVLFGNVDKVVTANCDYWQVANLLNKGSLAWPGFSTLTFGYNNGVTNTYGGFFLSDGRIAAFTKFSVVTSTGPIAFTDGISGTDPVGNVFIGGINTHLGTGSAVTSITGTSGGALGGAIAISGGTTGLTLTGAGSTLTLGGELAQASGGFGADVSAYTGLPMLNAGAVSDLTNTRASGVDLELKMASGKWFKMTAPVAY